MLKGFRDFIMRGNVLELAVAVAIGTAFTAVVTQFGDSFIKPLVAVFSGGGASGGTFKASGQTFDYGAFINAVIFFLITAAVIYFFVVVPYNAFEERRKRGQGPVAAADAGWIKNPVIMGTAVLVLTLVLYIIWW
jgi:large conductance mechanosensitive channel